MVVFVCLFITLHHYHHYVRYILPRSLCLRLSHFSQLSFMQHTGLCVFSLPMSLVMIVSTSILSYLILSYIIIIIIIIIIIKSEVWLICHCLRLGNETMVCAVCLFILWTAVVWFVMMIDTWWCHQMETFSALLALCAGNSPVTGEFPSQRPVTRSFDVFFDLRRTKRLSKQSWGCWFERRHYAHYDVAFR